MSPTGLLAAEKVGVVPVNELIQLFVAAVIMSGAVLILAVAVNSGRASGVRRAAAFLEAKTGIAGWAMLPLAVMLPSLVIGSFGMMWDVAWHIERGRDNGLVSQPSHVLSIIGLYGAFVGAALSLVMADGRPSRYSIRITRNLHVPLGGFIAFVAMAIVLTGFPLDDVWHRLFGLDVALWSPIHFVLLSGAIATFFAMLMLLCEGEAAMSPTGTPATRPAMLVKWLRLFFCGALLLAVGGILLAEWNIALPQADLVYDPLLMCAGLAPLVAARVLCGRGGALYAWLIAVSFAALLTFVVTVVLGNEMPRMPLLLGFALGVELAAELVGTKRWFPFALSAGFAGGVAGIVTEFAWAHLYRPLAWPLHLMPKIFLYCLPVAIAAGVVGMFFGRALLHDPIAATRSKVATAAVALGVVGVIGGSLSGPGVLAGGADLTVTNAGQADSSAVLVTVRFDPADVTDNADWLYAYAWQGGGAVFSPLIEQADGSWRTEKPLPVDGKWKSMIRLAKDGTRNAVPIRMPADEELGLTEIPAQSGTRDFIGDVQFTQREKNPDAAPWMATAGLAVCVSIWIFLVSILVWGLARMARELPRTSASVDTTETASVTK